jgi:hypothetical protein
MKKILIFFLLLLSLTLQAQKFDFKVKSQITHTVDLTVLTATTVYWMYADKVEPDKVIHFLFGYFATNAMQSLLSLTDMPKGLKMFTPILVFGGLAVFKELIDTKADWKDFYAGMIGCGISLVSFNIVYRF